MALLQIAEPNAAPAPHQHRWALGIDLGTTHSLVAIVRNGAPECLADEHGQTLLPSIVRYNPDGQTLVGRPAADAPGHGAIASIKRLMGRGYADIPHRESLSLDLIEGDGMVRLRTAQGTKTPVEISAQILGELLARARAHLGEDPVGAVITVPAYFDDAQRQATKDAARLAGIEVLRLLNEPTAAALAYGLDRAAEGIYAIYDLGGGTFDLSILRLSRGLFEVIATHGDSALGGDDFDHRIYCWMLEQARIAPPGHADITRMMRAARTAKEQLTQTETAHIALTLGSGETLDLTLDRPTFFALTTHLIEKTLTSVRAALRDAKLSPGDIDGIVLVGGATRMPHVRRAVADYFGKAPLTDLDPDQVVALGAARQANILAGNRDANEDWLLLDVIPLSLGIETLGGLAEKIIPRNATLPIARAQEFTTARDGQTAISIHVVQGEREMVADCRSLARFELRGIPPMVAGAARIRVTFQVDADGLLTVSAREESTGVQAHIAVQPSYGLNDSEIADMLRASLDHAAADRDARALAEAKLEGQQLLAATQSALAADGDLLTPEERTAIDRHCTDLSHTLQTAGDTVTVYHATEALAHATEEFAARRMNRSIRAALSGKKIDELDTPQ